MYFLQHQEVRAFVEDLEGSAPGAHITEGAMLNGITSEDEFKKVAEKFL